MRFIWTLLAVLLSCAAASAQTVDDLFNTNVLQEIRLDVNPKDWAAIRANPKSDTYYAANLRWRGLEVDNVGIRQRGNATRNGTKPGIRVDFNRFEPGQTFLGMKSMGLDNNAQDGSMMKERIVMQMFAKLGLPAAREVSAKVYVNDDYFGVYTLIEATDKNFLARRFSDSDGYLYEYVSPTNYRFEYLGADPALYSPRFFDPKTHESDPDPAPLVAWIKAMNTATDTNFASTMKPYIDLSLFMQHLAVEDFMAETDGILAGMNNFYLYRFTNKLNQFIPKDKDQTFGGGPANTNRPQTPLLQLAGKNVLIRGALTVPEARDAYFKTIASAAQFTGVGSWMETEITRIYNQIRDAVLADPVKQCFFGPNIMDCSNATFESEVVADLQFARTRGDFATGAVAQLAGARLFVLNDRGGMSATRTNSSVSVAVGYGTVDPDTTSFDPTGVEILSYRPNGVVVTETSVLASPSIQHGMTYAEIGSGVKTGLAIANPGSSAATVSFSYTDADGKAFGQGSLIIPAGGQIAKFLDEAPFNAGSSMRGTLTFDSSGPVFVVALRGLTNERSEFLLSTLPVIDATTIQGTLVIPHFADGGGWTTQIVLVNSSSQTMQGTVQMPTTSVNYSIAAHSYYRFQTSGSGATTQVGPVRIVPANGGAAPAGFAVYAFRKGGVTVSEASIQALRGTIAYRLYVENSDTIQTGIAIANLSSDPVNVNLEATTLSGASASLTGSVTIPGGGQLASFLNQIPGFENIASPFQGVLRVSTTSSAGIAVAGLRGRTNERGDFLIAGLPSVDENAAATKTEVAFPHYAEGAGYTTQFVLFSGTANTAPTGMIRLFDQSGNSITW